MSLSSTTVSPGAAARRAARLGRGSRSIAVVAMLLVACSSEAGGGSSGSSSSSSTGGPTSGTGGPGATSSGSGTPSTPTSGATTAEPTPSVSGSTPTPLASTKPSGPNPVPTGSGPGPVAVTPTASGSSTPSAPPTVTVPDLPPPEAGTADAIAAQIDALYAPLPRYKANFLQRYTQKVQGTEKESKGSVFVERKNKISFRYEAPNLNRIVSDAVTLKVYVADDQQMFENPVGNTEYPGAMAFIMGEGIRKSFTFSFNEKVKFEHGPVLIGKPRSPTPAYEKVQFYINKDKLDKSDLGAVVSVLILDAQGNKNRFEFYDAQQPGSIDPSEFTFTPPAGTNITKN